VHGTLHARIKGKDVWAVLGVLGVVLGVVGVVGAMGVLGAGWIVCPTNTSLCSLHTLHTELSMQRIKVFSTEFARGDVVHGAADRGGQTTDYALLLECGGGGLEGAGAYTPVGVGAGQVGP
jgi:hypothetical protein